VLCCRAVQVGGPVGVVGLLYNFVAGSSATATSRSELSQHNAILVAYSDCAIVQLPIKGCVLRSLCLSLGAVRSFQTCHA
jgi:hypothetical protein